jgi:tagatose-6-phosphate ketose/aldose isomerase
VLLLPPQSNDVGFAMTSSFTGMLLGAVLALAGDGAVDVDAAARAATGLLATPELPEHYAAQRPERLVYLGSGALAGLARESALKALELTAGRIATFHESSLGFRHGPKAEADSHTLVVVYISSNPYTRRYDLDIVRELRQELGSEAVVTLSGGTEVVPAGVTDGDDVVLTDIEGRDDIHRALAFAVFAQRTALYSSIALGLTPDNPFPSGDLSRVVHGVTIHPLA